MELDFKHPTSPRIIFLPVRLAIRAIDINATDCPLRLTVNSKYTITTLVESKNWQRLEKILQLLGEITGTPQEQWKENDAEDNHSN